jgi:type IV secretion system protein VirB5
VPKEAVATLKAARVRRLFLERSFGMKKYLSAMVVCLVVSTSAHAGIPTINIPDLIIQVVSWLGQYMQQADQIVNEADQLAQLEQQVVQFDKQIEQYKQEYDSLTGSRGLGDLLSNLFLRDVVPQDVSSVYSSIKAGGFGMTSAANDIRAATKIFDCGSLSGGDASRCKASLNKPSQDTAYSENALKLTSQRQDEIQGLQDQINSTDDPKAIAELQARIATEQAQVQNDSVRIIALQLESQNQDRLIEQQGREATMKNLSLPVHSDFSFTAP